MKQSLYLITLSFTNKGIAVTRYGLKVSSGYPIVTSLFTTMTCLLGILCSFAHSTTDVLGSGQFGIVFKGQWADPKTGRKMDVAVKMLKEGSKDEDKVKFLQEAAIVGQFSHPNVVKLHGTIIEGEQVSMCHGVASVYPIT